MIQPNHSRPLPNSYWVKPGQLMAGEHPGFGRLDDPAPARLRRLLDAGITTFLNLAESHDWQDYSRLLMAESAPPEKAIRHIRMPVMDMTIPTEEDMVQMLDTIDEALESGQAVYVHCLAGRGRTGTVVGCYLVRHGMSGQEALDEIARLRKGIPDAFNRSPETNEQRQMVLNWSVGK